MKHIYKEPTINLRKQLGLSFVMIEVFKFLNVDGKRHNIGLMKYQVVCKKWYNETIPRSIKRLYSSFVPYDYKFA